MNSFETGVPSCRRRFGVSNRRYLGSKTKLLPFIEKSVLAALGRVPETLFDIFAGSGVVGCHFANLGSRVVMNDILLHNSIAHETFLNHAHYSRESLAIQLDQMDELKPLSGYITDTFGDRYFSRENAMMFDAWMEFANSTGHPAQLRSALITSIIYAADKVAQTVGHYDAFLRSSKKTKPAQLQLPETIGKGSGHLILNTDANIAVNRYQAEVMYVDPPYNSRQYSDTYHVLENLARWEKPPVFGVSRKMDRTCLKSPYSGRFAEEAFEELVVNAKADLIVLSYSNTGKSRIARSNNVLSDQHIMKVLKSRGRVDVKVLPYKEFSAGKTSLRQHTERVFLCRVGQR